MMLEVNLDVKFRAFFIDFAKFSHHWSIPLPIPVPVPAQTLVALNERGVKLTINLV